MTTLRPNTDNSSSAIPPHKQYVDSGNTTSTTGLTVDSLPVDSATATTTTTEIEPTHETTTSNIITEPKRRQQQARASVVTFADDLPVLYSIDDARQQPHMGTEDAPTTPNTTTASTHPINTSPTIVMDGGKTEDFTSPVSETTSTSTSSKNASKFQSKQLRGNLTRKQSNRSPYTYYEVINVLGLGSMGSVAMVKKRPDAIGGSARKRNTTSEILVRSNHSRSSTDPNDSTPPCFQLPIISPIICWFHDTFRQKDGMRMADSENRDQNSDTFSGSGYDDQSSFDTKSELKIKSFESFQNPRSNDSYDMTYAMKSIHISRCTDPTFVEELQNEIQILKTLDHPHIEKVMETFEYESQIFVILELCYGGDLYQRDPYTEDEAARITSSILSAISYMHSKNILHRDLKYENILFVDDSPTAEIKLIDFGLSKKLYSADQNECTDGVGTIYTMAPEVLKGKYTKQADLWSIGVIAYMLMSSQMPFYGRTRGDIVAQIMEGQYEYKGRRWKRISKAGKAFVDDLLVVDPDDRATDDEALRASWLNRRYNATVRNPKMEEMNLAKDSVLRYSKYSKIRRMALMVIAHKSTSAEIGILRKIFQQYDTKGTGHLNYEQFKAAIADSSLEEDDYRRIFDAVDLDGSEKIRYTEFLAATIEASGTINEVKLAEAFDRLDSDDSGYISVDNLLEILGDNFTKEDVEMIIKEVTVTNGQISYSEFLSLWESTESNNDDEDLTEGLSGDGFVINTIREEPNGVIKTVYMNSSKNPFLDSERSTGAISTLSSENDDTMDPKTTTTNAIGSMSNTTTTDEPGNISRVNFLQGKMISERNMVLLDQAKKQNHVSVQQ